MELPADDLVIIQHRTGRVDIQAPHRENMTVEEAIAYLASCQDGVLRHDMFEVDSFITVDRNGVHLFYHGVNDTIERWDWGSDLAALKEWDGDTGPMTGWWYDPGIEMSVTVGGAPWWDSVRSGALTPPGGQTMSAA